ncbi:hypothetical protein [Sphingobacterium detergens]|uniref:Uncharacterized protein n=1 Tax=Sphingobacterium detergens TaxID=1145106 RepID=A0A420BH13_SPHD1|nr:hypothetical protein [Sphingobacterium detergens]RKE55990.1 hypothetical protein DFQ12_0839 [Sphingobacterium detergens]
MNLSRKIAGNLLVAMLAPIFFKIGWIPVVFDAVFYNKYKYYDFQIDSLGVFLKHVYLETFIYEYLFAIIIIFLPFQLIKDYLDRKSSVSFFRKMMLLSCIVAVAILLVGTFSNIWWIPWYENFKYLVFSLGFGVLFSSILDVVIDRHIEKS